MLPLRPARIVSTRNRIADSGERMSWATSSTARSASELASRSSNTPEFARSLAFAISSIADRTASTSSASMKLVRSSFNRDRNSVRRLSISSREKLTPDVSTGPPFPSVARR